MDDANVLLRMDDLLHHITIKHLKINSTVEAVYTFVS